MLRPILVKSEKVIRKETKEVIFVFVFVNVFNAGIGKGRENKAINIIYDFGFPLQN